MNLFDAFKNLKFIIKLLLVAISLLSVLLIITTSTALNLSDNRVHRISIPHNLEFGAVIDTGDIDPFEVYNFTGYVTQQLYHWANNGEEDFQSNMSRLSAFFTPSYRQYLLDEYNNLLKLGELTGRERTLQPIKHYSSSLVKAQDNGWTVQIDYRLQEHIDNKRFKDFNIRYEQRIVIRDIDAELNPWGYQIDIPVVKPLRIK